MAAALLIFAALALGFYLGRWYEAVIQRDERERRWQEHRKCRCEVKH